MISSAAARVQDRSGVAEVRRLGVDCAERLGWSETDRGNAAIVATELASNLVKHARDGIVTISGRASGAATRLDFIAVDHGPGMRNVERCLEDGFSTAGSHGTGLGAISRLTDRADVFSSERGTVIAVEMRRRDGPDVPSAGLNVSGLVVPKESEPLSGDGWDCRVGRDRLTVLICDGLGHGHYAHEATAVAMQVFRGTEWQTPKDAMAAIDVALRPTRGAAAAVAMVDAAARKVRYCGVGNIAATVVSDAGSRHLVSRSGILGHARGRSRLLVGQAAAHLTEFDYPWSDDAVLVLHSDGIGTRWQADSWEGLWRRLPGVVAGSIYRDFARGSDDVVVVAVRRE